jgi:DNA (cytosine-5)-methyltransferase 1
MNYYNEFDPKAAAWIRELIKAGMIPDGEVDERSITDVRPKDLYGFVQCHFFAGIGGWPYALRLAGWPDNKECWSGSCPCQPFSVAGKGKGLEDERHLWPAFRWLIAQCRPSICFGEQVASKDGREWLAGVRSDLEAMGYVVGAADLCAASVGAPHIRQRLWWLADSKSVRSGEGWAHTTGSLERDTQEQRAVVERYVSCFGMAHTEKQRMHGEVGNLCEAQCGQGDALFQRVGCGSAGGGVVNLFKPGLEGYAGDGYDGDEPGRIGTKTAGSVAAPSWNGPAVWWPCRDGKLRRIPSEPEIFPLAPGLPGRVGLLRGAGNAIVPQVAAEFIEAVIESIDDLK